MSAHYKCDRCPEPGINDFNGERLCDSCYDSDACCHTLDAAEEAEKADTADYDWCGTTRLIGAYRENLTVYYTEVDGELALFVTAEEQGRDLKDTLCINDFGIYGTGNLEESEKADLFEVPDAKVADWLVENEISPNNVYWGEIVMRMPEGYKLIRGDWR
jgi:hypothetical protein